MGEKRFDIPAVDQTLEPKVRRPLERMRQALQMLLGTAGDPLDAALTLRRTTASGLTDGSGAPVGGGGGGGPTEPDLTPPPSPTGLLVTPGSTVVIVEWAAPGYTQGHGHGQTNVYAVKRDPASVDPLPTFANAVPVYQATGFRTIADLPSEPNVQWHVWITWQSLDGVEGAPAGGTNGYQVTTVQIGEEQLGVNAVTDAKVANLSASKLTVGDGTVGGDLKSTVFTSGSVGWRIRPNGTAEFSGVIVRGTVYATAGLIGGITIASGAVHSADYDPGVAGFSLNDDGTAEFQDLTARGNITANTLDAAVGTIDLLRNTDTGARYELSGDGFEMFDDANVQRLFLGIE